MGINYFSINQLLTPTHRNMESIQFLLETKISDTEILKFEKEYQQQRLLAQKDGNTTKLNESLADSMFTYAHALSQSNYKKDWKESLSVFQELYELSSDDHARRDYLFYCSLNQIKLHN